MRHILAALVAAVPLTLVATAHATTVVNVVSDVEKVVLEPSADAPVRIQVHGVFSLAEGGPSKPYGAAVRGYLYFACPVGREVDCKTHFLEIQKAIGDVRCAGLGQAGETLPKVRATGTTPSSPDTYSFGLGVMMSEWHGGACAQAKALPNTTTPDAGTVDSAPPADTGAGIADTGTADTGTAATPASPAPAESSGCSMIPRSGGASSSSGALLLVAALIATRRRSLSQTR